MFLFILWITPWTYILNFLVSIFSYVSHKVLDIQANRQVTYSYFYHFWEFAEGVQRFYVITPWPLDSPVKLRHLNVVATIVPNSVLPHMQFFLRSGRTTPSCSKCCNNLKLGDVQAHPTASGKKLVDLHCHNSKTGLHRYLRVGWGGG